MSEGDIRREMFAEINANASERELLEAKFGRVWNTAELQSEYAVTGFAAPFVVVIRKSDGVHGSLKFQHSPRLYFFWKADE